VKPEEHGEQCRLACTRTPSVHSVQCSAAWQSLRWN
jgi:hypothetical protein